jgi:hypothetical protein
MKGKSDRAVKLESFSAELKCRAGTYQDSQDFQVVGPILCAIAAYVPRIHQLWQRIRRC